MTFGNFHEIFITELQRLYPADEARTITRWVFESLTGITPSQMVLKKEAQVPEAQAEKLTQALAELKTHRPVQYVLNEAWFYGLKFHVNPSVLIPRPETEELVAWMISDVKNMHQPHLRILDIGTGSGCIAISLKKNLPQSQVTAIDISEAALETAGQNAAEQKADVQFRFIDMLNEVQREALDVYDIIVSNPPYIPLSDKASMHPNVLLHEPHLALFVANNDPLVFYREIALWAKGHLAAGGKLYFEIHEALGADVLQLLQSEGYTAQLRRDAQGKDRMIKAER